MNLTSVQFFQNLNKKNRLTLLSILFLAMFLHVFDLYLEGYSNLDPLHLGVKVAVFILYISIIVLILTGPAPFQPQEYITNEMDSDNAETKTDTTDTTDATDTTDTTDTTDNNISTVQPTEINDTTFAPCLATQMQTTFKEWKLTAAEQKVASLLILGHSLKEIAENCHRGEGTVRQHATIIYKKAQLSGRAKLTGYFLEELINTEKLFRPSEKDTQTGSNSAKNTNES
ncbi:hypothetical protein CYQ88_00425 [Hydrogenovibrio sp. SC-1]|uniref:helix-turn-helix transcriptional regulator n=1 Tax=Hydrogenovibrio sp. SC-1 TaxID=2065820 RepID=UPI000C7C8293|nr:helix-turn-helix transcriptional regulator [Hydrogenovibrio sp. SC-1]PLA75468.1 hypothetical protein CYQ88_00425 [Hydrogenovibrio sp. SC-1]